MYNNQHKNGTIYSKNNQQFYRSSYKDPPVLPSYHAEPLLEDSMSVNGPLEVPAVDTSVALQGLCSVASSLWNAGPLLVWIPGGYGT
ncbi:hypothetical protein NQZ68_026491 [Dissostichus eleginoides]|nr:hypothetical protein NQZ68_026491 [Dissostichus eleginoides]